jgi:hypothetical protein
MAMFRDLTLSILVAVAMVLMAHVVVWAAAFQIAVTDSEVWFTAIGP